MDVIKKIADCVSFVFVLMKLTISGVSRRVAIGQLPPKKNFIATYFFFSMGNCPL
jgi:hypothetical protein